MNYRKYVAMLMGLLLPMAALSVTAPASAATGDVSGKQLTVAVAPDLRPDTAVPGVVVKDDPRPEVWQWIAKKALIKLLRTGGSKIPGRFGKWATKMANVVEDLNDMSEVALAIGFQKIGMPPHLAWDAARWCATFL